MRPHRMPFRSHTAMMTKSPKFDKFLSVCVYCTYSSHSSKNWKQKQNRPKKKQQATTTTTTNRLNWNNRTHYKNWNKMPSRNACAMNERVGAPLAAHIYTCQIKFQASNNIFLLSPQSTCLTHGHACTQTYTLWRIRHKWNKHPKKRRKAFVANSTSRSPASTYK